MTSTYDGITSGKWLAELGEHKLWPRRHFLALLAMMGTPKNILDVGCGAGECVHAARMLQIDAFGVDQLVNPEWNQHWYLHHDLRNPFSLGQFHANHAVVDMVLCWEVAEHIPEEYLHIFCDTVANHVERGGHLCWTSAHPGQGGTNHHSEKSHTYWRDTFYERGLNYRDDLSKQLALLWTNIGSPLWWLGANVMVFDK